MRHARRIDSETLGSTARIATGGQSSDATHGRCAPGRTYPEIARRHDNENLGSHARDSSPAMSGTQPTRTPPGSTYSNSLAKRAVQSNDLAPARGAA